MQVVFIKMFACAVRGGPRYRYCLVVLLGLGNRRVHYTTVADGQVVMLY
jgi:hypothetical protein